MVVLLLAASVIGFAMVSQANILKNLPDVAPADQGGGFDTEYDMFFSAAADSWGVPFALLKAHAIQESSLNPNAFLDENPQKDPARQGWASRGLMQLLWWPGSERFQKFGYPDETLGTDALELFDPHVNLTIAAQLVKANLIACRGNIRDAVNMYNTGKKEADLEAPNGYVDKVVGYYSTLVNKGVS